VSLFQPGPADHQEARPRAPAACSLGATAGQGTAEGLPAPKSMEAVTCGNVRLGKAQSVGVLSGAPSG
jgi:hypothetical protein